MKRFVSIMSAVALGVGTLVAGAGSATADAAVIVRPGESIQAAINRASPGTTIVVKKGVYRENLDVATDRLTLVGSDARLRPPASPGPSPCADPEHPGAVNGICIHGQVSFGPQGVTVTRPVRGVTVTGFSIQGFSGIGIFVVGAADTEIASNKALNDGAYGIFANSSTNTLIAHNRTTSAEEAGIYVGDSPNARAQVVGNETARNGFGVFIRAAQRGSIDDNLIHDNCVGTLVLGDAPGPAGGFRMNGNTITHNGKLCVPDAEDGTPGLSGLGILIASGRNMNVQKNWIVDNVPGGPSEVSGGVVLFKGGPSTPDNNTVRRNVIVFNQLDIFSDRTGSGNVLTPNFCRTSDPPGLCTAS